MKLKRTLKQLLDVHDTTQKQLAEALSLSPSALGNYIQGTREPDYNTLIRIADYFHVTTDFLLDHCQAPAPSQEEELLLHIFRALTAEQKEFYLEQGQIFLRQNQKKGSCSFPPTQEENRDVS